MKITNRTPVNTADISSARGSILKEFWQMAAAAFGLVVVLYFTTGFVVDMVVSRISFETEAHLFKHFKLHDANRNRNRNANEVIPFKKL